MPNSIIKWFEYSKNTSNVFSDRFILIIFIIISLTLIFNILFSIYINTELITNLDKFISVHNHFK